MDNYALKLTYVNNPLFVTLDSGMKLFLGNSRLRKMGVGSPQLFVAVLTRIEMGMKI